MTPVIHTEALTKRFRVSSGLFGRDARYVAAVDRVSLDIHEGEIVAEISAKRGLVVATGGGTVLRPENVAALRQSGRLYLLDRPLSALEPSSERPLGDMREKVERLYRERMPVYRAAADEIVPALGTPEEMAVEIERRWLRRWSNPD